MADEKCVRDPRHDCFGLEAAARLEGRIKALEDWQQDEQVSNMEKNMEERLAKQEEQTAKPGRRWEAIVDKSVWAVLAAVIAFILARIGL